MPCRWKWPFKNTILFILDETIIDFVRLLTTQHQVADTSQRLGIVVSLSGRVHRVGCAGSASSVPSEFLVSTRAVHYAPDCGLARDRQMLASLLRRQDHYKDVPNRNVFIEAPLVQQVVEFRSLKHSRQHSMPWNFAQAQAAR